MLTIRRTLIILALCLPLRLLALSFVQITDPQLGMVKYADDLATFKRAVVQINSLKPDFTVICGDLIANPRPEAYPDIAAAAGEFKSPWYVAPGNHDEWKGAEYTKYFTATYRAVDQGKLTLVTINTLLLRDVKAEVAEEHMTWLEGVLKEADARKQQLIVAGHHPLFLKSPDEKNGGDNLPLTLRPRVVDLFVKYHVLAYLTGHLHYNLVASYQGITLVSNASSVKNFSDDPIGYRVWNLDDKGYLTQKYVGIKP
ncbi:MAG: metallophosphoesterase [bacterium]